MVADSLCDFTLIIVRRLVVLSGSYNTAVVTLAEMVCLIESDADAEYPAVSHRVPCSLTYQCRLLCYGALHLVSFLKLALPVNIVQSF